MTRQKPHRRGASFRVGRPMNLSSISHGLLVLLGLAIAVVLTAGAPAAHAIPRDDASGSGPVITGLETKWQVGSPAMHLGTIFNNGEPKQGLLAVSDVWWTDDAGTGRPPRTGDTWIGAAHIAVYDPNPGSTGVEFVVTLPPNTSFAIDANHRISCTRIPSDKDITEIDVTNDPSYRCPSAPTRTPEGWSLGTREIPKFNQFVITFPLKSSAPLRGPAGPGLGHRLTVSVRPQLGETKEPWVYVGAPVWDPARPMYALLTCVWDNPSNPGPC
jgi:hypothetical protein